MTRTKAWAVKDKFGRFVQSHNDPQHPFKTFVFKTRRKANQFLLDSPYWRHKAEPVQVTITVKELGAP